MNRVSTVATPKQTLDVPVGCNSLSFAGIHTCFVCKKRSEDVRRCMIPVCGKFYHGECIANFAPTVAVNRGFRCSIHVCLTCFIANPNSSTISKGEAGCTYARTSAFLPSLQPLNADLCP